LTSQSNPNDILHQFVVGNPPPAAAAAVPVPVATSGPSTSASGDRCLFFSFDLRRMSYKKLSLLLI